MARQSMGFRTPVGSTLVELVAVLAIAAILVGLGAPSMSEQRAGAAVRSAAGELLGAMHLARRMALATGSTMTVCASTDGTRCGFDGGQWMLFANLEGGAESRRDPGEEILRHWQLPAGVRVSGTRGYAAFQPRIGAASTLTFEFCHPAAPDLHLALIVSQTGRPRISRPDRPSMPPQASCP